MYFVHVNQCLLRMRIRLETTSTPKLFATRPWVRQTHRVLNVILQVKILKRT